MLDLVIAYPRAASLLIVIVLNWAAFVILNHASRQHPRGIALRERSRAALILSLALTLAFPLLLNVQFDFPWLDRDMLVWAGYFVTVIAGLPAIVWLFMYMTGSWNDE